MEKIFVKFDESEFNSERAKVWSAFGEAERIVNQINAIGSYKVDKAGFNDVLTGRGESVADAIERTTRAELQRAGIGSTAVHSAAVNADLEKYWSIKKGFVFRETELVPLLQINELGSVGIVPGVDEVLREKHTYYIETERGATIRKAHEDAVNAINDLLTLAPQLRGVGMYLGIFPLVYGENRVGILGYNYDRL